jgi:hypothetical protein
MSTVQANRFTDSSGGVLAPISSVMRNRLINGAMVLDQRAAGASTSVLTSAQYVSCDRWGVYNTQSNRCTVQQNAGAVTPPAGFTNYIGITSSSAYSSLSGDIFVLYQAIEGFNTADLGFGTANAKTVTLSFWVRSSLTGTFGGSLQSASNTRAYPFTYTISSANTWEQKSITIAGDTSGTMNTTNGVGLTLNLNLGTGTTFSGTAGAWASTNFFSATGAQSVVGTNGATFYITGVQLEVGTQATSFEYRQYTTELQLCQRYYQVKGCVVSNTSGAFINTVHLPVSMRAAPTIGTVTFDSGSGATFSTLGSQASGSLGVYQNANHSGVALATSIPLSAEL